MYAEDLRELQARMHEALDEIDQFEQISYSQIDEGKNMNGFEVIFDYRKLTT
jgi:hypothetical protein